MVFLFFELSTTVYWLLSYFSLECLESTLESSRTSYIQLIQKLPQTTKHSSATIRVAVSLLFYTIAMLKSCIPDEDMCTIIEAQTKELVQSTHSDVTKWIRIKYGSMFGSPTGMTPLLCADEELEVP